MSDYSLVPVDHQPDFDDVSLVPVEHDPFSGSDTVQQAGSQPANQPRYLETRADLPDIDTTTQFSAANKAADIAKDDIPNAPQLAPLIVPSGDSSKPGSGQQYSMASHAQYSKCVDKCLHLLRSPSGDLQSSKFRQCVGQCMGRL